MLAKLHRGHTFIVIVKFIIEINSIEDDRLLQKLPYYVVNINAELTLSQE